MKSEKLKVRGTMIGMHLELVCYSNGISWDNDGVFGGLELFEDIFFHLFFNAYVDKLINQM